MKTGDMVTWTVTSNHDYFSDCKKVGIFLREVSIYQHWILAEVLDCLGQRQQVMLLKRSNPL
jgi:hypothetical protein